MTTTKQAGSGASMVVPAVGQKRLVFVGATGMVGGYALRFALDNLAVEIVTSIGRKNLGISHPKLKEVLHQNFTDCSLLANVLSAQDAVVYWYRTSNYASLPLTIRSNSREFSAAAALTPHSRF